MYNCLEIAGVSTTQGCHNLKNVHGSLLGVGFVVVVACFDFFEIKKIFKQNSGAKVRSTVGNSDVKWQGSRDSVGLLIAGSLVLRIIWPRWWWWWRISCFSRPINEKDKFGLEL